MTTIPEDISADVWSEPWAGDLLHMVDRLRKAGIEPVGVQIPALDPKPAGTWTAYGVPVVWVPMPGEVRVLVGVR